uniref:Uncharacterized protein n=1 Tax=Arundo donax TaxID=35708 RepID=A0A0A9BH51_ARUDO
MLHRRDRVSRLLVSSDSWKSCCELYCMLSDGTNDCSITLLSIKCCFGMRVMSDNIFVNSWLGYIGTVQAD